MLETTLIFRHVTDVEEAHQIIVNLHVEVRGDFGLMDRPFNSPERFGERLTGHSSRPGWEAVIGYDGDEPIGFCYVVPLGPDTKWWSSMITPLPEGYVDEDGRRTLAFNEIVVRGPWRGKGVAKQLHDEVLGGRSEGRVTLLVNPQAGDGKVKAVYESWGYQQIGSQQPFSDSPVFSVMMKEPLK
ncbi:GNAT family N-acetyltransferase [Kitasatospora sp. NPDC098663]|uniref:GNAT family N-acetyltransferase n=1 Tax=Kitasatospora sp. NPDC098663 TaxID=3364096 RepID=UPI003812CDB1